MVSFPELVEDFSHIELATEADNQSLLNFYKNESMKADGAAISFDRGDDFYAFYKSTTDKFWCFKFLNDDGSICGIATILRHWRYMNGELVPLAYFCDLRVSPKAGRRAQVQWRKLYPLIVKSLKNLGPDDYCVGAYTAILAQNQDAINSLTKSGRGMSYRYINDYYVHSFVVMGPFTYNKYEVKKIDRQTFLNFYHQQTNKRFLSEQEIKSLDYFKDKGMPYLLGVFHQNKLCAITAPLFENPSRKLKVIGLKGLKKAALNSLKFVGRPAPSSTGVLKTLDFTYFTYDNESSAQDVQDYIKAIEHWLKKEKLLSQVHIMNIIDPKYKYQAQLAELGLYFTTVGKLYEVHPEDEDGVLPTTEFRFEGAYL
jgi:hypothetical protein